MEEKEFTPFKSSPLLPLFEKFSKVRDVSLVYGDPIEMHGRTIIPVAQVKYSVGAGAGGGYEKDPQSDNPSGMEGGHGEGAGGSFQIKPLGIYDITAEKSVYRPIAPVELIVLVPLLLTGLVLFLSSSKNQDDHMNLPKKVRMRNGSRCKKQSAKHEQKRQ